MVLHSKRTVLPNGIKEAYVLVKDGSIAGVEPTNPWYEMEELVELGNNLLMPGVIDPHVHINEPGRTDWEGFDTATKAAIVGGVTTLVDMPLNSSPVTVSVKALEEKINSTQNKLHTNIGFWGGVIPGNDNEIEDLIDKGVLGFKAFLTHSGIDEFPNATEDDVRKVMPILAKHNLPLLVHCELTDSLQRSPANTTKYYEYLASRPKSWENDAIEMMIRLCSAFNCRVHVVHLSSADAIGPLRQAKKSGLPITVETGQHYLYFCAEQIGDGQTQFKCAPPIREKENNELLWEALKSGLIDFVATDHSPAPPDMKQLESGNFMEAWGGIASLQFALPVLWTAAKKRNIGFKKIVQWLCENPAKLIGKENNKGKIAIGFDADLVVFDEQQQFTVDTEMIRHRHKITPYLNETLFGVVKQTYLGGKKVFDKGELIALNQGKLIFGNED